MLDRHPAGIGQQWSHDAHYSMHLFQVAPTHGFVCQAAPYAPSRTSVHFEWGILMVYAGAYPHSTNCADNTVKQQMSFAWFCMCTVEMSMLSTLAVVTGPETRLYSIFYIIRTLLFLFVMVFGEHPCTRPVLPMVR